MAKPVISLDEAETFAMQGGDGSVFAAKIAQVGSVIGAGQLGAMLTIVEPGKRAFPFHNHLGNDEMFVILEGAGTYRFGAEEYQVRAGDVCAAPRGGPETAHQISNTGDKILKYISISTKHDPDIVEYPDSGKFAAMAVAPGRDFMSAHLKFIGRTEDSRDYWEGEI